MKAQQFSYVFAEEPAAPFDFKATVQAHGWVALQPFAWDEAKAELSRIHPLDQGPAVHIRMRAGSQSEQQAVQVTVETTQPLTPAGEAEIRRAVRRMLRLDEDLTEFYRRQTALNGQTPPIQSGAGRLLRCPTLFEDIVYTLCVLPISVGRAPGGWWSGWRPGWATPFPARLNVALFPPRTPSLKPGSTS